MNNGVRLPGWCGWSCILCGERGNAQTEDEACESLRRHYRTTGHMTKVAEVERKDRSSAAAPEMLELLRAAADGSECGPRWVARVAALLARIDGD